MNSKNKVVLISVIVGVLVIGLVVGANVSGKATSDVKELATTFPIEAWGYGPAIRSESSVGVWGDCSGQTAMRDRLDIFCRRNLGIGHELADGDACLHEYKYSRWRWDGAFVDNAQVMKKGIARSGGYALTRVKCTSSDAGDSASSSKQDVLDMFEGRCDVGYVDETYTWFDSDSDGRLTSKEVCNNGQHTKTGGGSACVMAFLQEESNSPLRPSDCEEQHILGDFDKLWTTCCVP